jgi:hypothetical protein
MENFSLLGSLSGRLHQEFVNIFYLLLPAFFALAIAVDWFRNPGGSPDFLDTLKRAIIATLLVAGFQEISEIILAITSGIADKISDMSGLDSIMQMAGEKAKSYTMTPISLVLGFNDLMVAVLSFASYIVLYIARFITIALFHFMWLFLSILSPLLILFAFFRGTSQITMNLFRSLIEVASYKIVWATLSAMITCLSFGNAYAADGNYLVVILLNFIIAIAMLGTPMIIKSLVGGGLSTMGESLGMGAALAMVSAPAKAETVFLIGREVLGNTQGYMSHMSAKAYPFIAPHMPGLNTVQNDSTSSPPTHPTQRTNGMEPSQSPPSSTKSQNGAN